MIRVNWNTVRVWVKVGLCFRKWLLWNPVFWNRPQHWEWDKALMDTPVLDTPVLDQALMETPVQDQLFIKKPVLDTQTGLASEPLPVSVFPAGWRGLNLDSRSSAEEKRKCSVWPRTASILMVCKQRVVALYQCYKHSCVFCCFNFHVFIFRSRKQEGAERVVETLGKPCLQWVTWPLTSSVPHLLMGEVSCLVRNVLGSQVTQYKEGTQVAGCGDWLFNYYFVLMLMIAATGRANCLSCSLSEVHLYHKITAKPGRSFSKSSDLLWCLNRDGHW